MNLIEYIIVISLTVYIISTNMYIISPIKFKKLEFFGLILITDIISFIIIVILSLSQYLIGLISTALIILFSYYKTKNTVIILVNASFPLSITLIANYLTVNIFALFNINGYKLSFQSYLIFCVVSMISSFLISYLLNFILNKKLEVKKIILQKDQTLLMIIFSAISFVMIYFNIFFGMDYYDSPALRITSLGLILTEFILTIYTMFYFLKTVRIEEENRRKEEMIEQMNRYTKEIEALYNSIKGFKHDYKNMLVTMSVMIDDEKTEDLKDFFYNEIYPYSENSLRSTLQIGDLTNIDITQVKSLIASKAVIAQEEKPSVNFSVEIIGKISKIDMDVIDLCRALGIVIDNAIEAARACKVPYVRIAIFKVPKTIVIVIKNNFEGELPDIYELYGKGYSSKGNNRGSGLINLKKILAAYENVYIDLNKQNKEFCVTLKIFFKERDIEDA